VKNKGCGIKKTDEKRGFTDGVHKKSDPNTLDERPLNSTYRDGDDGGFLGRAKGWDR